MRDLLAPIGLAYGGVAEIRSFLYTQDFLKGEKLNKPVISVGNLTVGGTGKTPLVDFLLTQFERQNLKACVLTRGYGRIDNGSSSQVLNEKSLPSTCGDEPVWLSRRHPKSFVVVGADRIESANLIKDVDIFILDDGLQHLKLRRDLDIVLLDCTAPPWHYRPLPWGYGREKFSGIKRSDIVVLTRANQVSVKEVEDLRNKVKSHGVSKIVESHLIASGCQDIWTQKSRDVKDKNVFLVSGIANPKSFENSARALGAKIVGHDIRPDHYIYTEESVEEIVSLSKKAGAQIILTTEKDSIKLKTLSFQNKEMPIYHLVVTIEFKPELSRIYELAVDRFR